MRSANTLKINRNTNRMNVRSPGYSANVQPQWLSFMRAFCVALRCEMPINVKTVTAIFVAIALVLVPFPRPAFAQGGEPRLALVIGNADYRDGALATAANDAGLIADSLRAASFEVNGAANLDSESLRRAFRDFLAKAAQAGPEAIAFIYLSGRGLQYEGENYFAPIEAVICISFYLI